MSLTWLSPLGYETPLYSYDTITKALLHLPYVLGKKFYDFTWNFVFIDRTLNLMFKLCLKKPYFSRLVLSNQETSNKRINNKKTIYIYLAYRIIFHESKDKEDENVQKSEKEGNFKRQDLNKVNRTLKAWMCDKGHLLLNRI